MAEAHTDSHSHQSHPFHLVDPSPWPIVSSMVLLIIVTGALWFMHNQAHGGMLLAGGFAMVLGVMFAWWRDVIREGLTGGHHTLAVQRGLRMGMLFFITSEVMFFVAFFWAFFNASLDPRLPIGDTPWPAVGIWPPAGIKPFETWDLPFINTLILLLSGTTVTWAHHALMHGNNRDVIRGLWCTVILGLSFTALQAIEYHHAEFAFKDGIFPSTFFMATGFHGFHVIVGTIFLSICLIRAYKGQLTPKGHLGFEFAAWYWHFVDVVWLFLFACVYWWGS